MDYFDILFAKANGVSKSSCYNEIEAMLKTTVGHSSKNLLDIDGFDDTLYNVHGYCENGYFRLVGTYQSDGAHQFFRIFFNLPAGSYILSGAPDYNTTPIRIAMCTYTSSPSDYTTIGYDFGKNLSFTLNEDSNCFIAFRFQSGAIGVPIDLTLPVMIRSASISDNTFEPYVTPTDEKKQDKIKMLYVAPSLESTSDEVTIPRTNDIDLFVAICLAIGDTNTTVSFIVPQELFGYPCVNGDFSITGRVVDETHNKLTFGFPNTFSAGKIIRVLGIPNISYEAGE